MFKVTTYDFTMKNFDNWDLKYDYHAIYILENGRQGYIGETADIIARAKKHSRSLMNKKYKFCRIHVITGKYSEATPARHYEMLLINLMRADKKFIILNKKKGYRFIQYNRKNRFELYFDELWFELEKKGLVNSKDFNSIVNSEIYRYSPFNRLNREQCKTLTTIVNVIDSGETLPIKRKYKQRPIIVDGDAGTGKTLVGIVLFNYLKNHKKYKDMSIAYVVPNTSPRDLVEAIFTKMDGVKKSDVVAPIELTKRKYDIVICDEAHKLRKNKNLHFYGYDFKVGNDRLGLDKTHDELDWILMQSKYQILFYDKKQITSPTEISGYEFEKRIMDKYRGIRPIRLKKQMRIQAGRSYVKYIYDILYQRVKDKKIFNNYDLKIFPKYIDMKTLVREKDKKYGLTAIASGYGFEWIRENTENKNVIFIDGVKERWNGKPKGWIRKGHYKDEIGSIYTIAGLDLNYIGVVIGPELYYDKQDNKIKVNKDNFFDNTVKTRVSDEELLTYVLNSYGVMLTRAIFGTYIYVCDDNLREYLSKFIDLHN